MKIMTVICKGIRPLIMHNGLLADPLNEFSNAIKKISSKGSKKLTESDHAEMQNLEWDGGLYWDEKIGLYLPSDNIERCIVQGAMKSRRGKDFQAACLCTDVSIPIEHPMKGKTREQMLKNPEYILRKSVRIKDSRIMRVRPRVPEWSITFDLEYDDSVVSVGDIKTALVNAGTLVGLGDWRPKYGRFIPEF